MNTIHVNYDLERRTGYAVSVEKNGLAACTLDFDRYTQIEDQRKAGKPLSEVDGVQLFPWQGLRCRFTDDSILVREQNRTHLFDRAGNTSVVREEIIARNNLKMLSWSFDYLHLLMVMVFAVVLLSMGAYCFFFLTNVNEEALRRLTDEATSGRGWNNPLSILFLGAIVWAYLISPFLAWIVVLVPGLAFSGMGLGLGLAAFAKKKYELG